MKPPGFQKKSWEKNIAFRFRNDNNVWFRKESIAQGFSPG
jgi:hypothetical protein